MKKILLIFFTFSIIYANHIKWQGNYDNGLKQARDENKVLMILLIKNNCQKCKDIVKNLFMDKYYTNDILTKIKL